MSNLTTVVNNIISKVNTHTTALNTKVDKVTSTDNAIVRFDGTTGNVQNSGVIIDDSNNVNTSGSIYSANMVGFKNYIINGNFDVWQYKDAGLTYPQTASGYGSDDRWVNINNGSTKTHSQVTCTNTERALFNASYFSRTVVSSVAGATNICVKTQRIEDVTRLAGKTVTLSFWAKADSNKNIGIELEQIFGTGGAPSTSVAGIGAQLVSLTTTWQKKSITVTIPSIVGKTLGTDGVNTSYTHIVFGFDIGSTFSTQHGGMIQQSGTFDIAQVQLEEGSVATPFEQRPIGLELSLCKRYYQLGDGTIKKHSTSGNHLGTQPLSIPYFMRVSPTLSFSKTGIITGTNALEYHTSSSRLYIFGGFDYSSAAVGDYTLFSFTASAEL